MVATNAVGVLPAYWVPTDRRRSPRRSLDDAVLPEPRDLVGRVVQLAQDLVRVLAVRGRGAADRTGRAGEGGRESLDPDLAALGMAHGLGQPQVLHLRILEDLRSEEPPVTSLSRMPSSACKK